MPSSYPEIPSICGHGASPLSRSRFQFELVRGSLFDQMIEFEAVGTAMEKSSQASRRRPVAGRSRLPNGRISLVAALVSITLLVVAVIVLFTINSGDPGIQPRRRSDDSVRSGDLPFAFDGVSGDSQSRAPRMIVHDNLTLHWDALPANLQRDLVPTSSTSNIRPQDYAGPESCKKCHKKNYDNWSKHAHRWMNAIAGPDTVKGDFSGEGTISYQGAQGFFYQEDDAYWMKIERKPQTHVYRIDKTLGSRFFQYYIGRGVEGPAPEGHEYYREEQVLPFGYWLDRRMWVPIVHVAKEAPDEGGRWNPLSPPFESERGKVDLIYANRCSICHTTYPIGDSLVLQPEFRSEHLPEELFLSVADYAADSHPDLWDGTQDPRQVTSRTMYQIIGRIAELQTPDQAATLGISCEACHLGAKAHAEGKQKKPSFLAQSEHLRTSAQVHPRVTDATHDNVNWVCSRCHVGGRPEYASGAATWNSVEYSDAVRGACYSQLTCIHCHDPHEAIGSKWSKPPEEDDAVCISCHKEYEPASERQRHTHHPAGTAGARCLNCHMPRINEGMQDAVRTHMISSPVRPDMIEAGHPNACNLCHLDEPIDWTLQHLRDWYGAEYDPAKIAAAYPERDKPLGVRWLEHAHEPTRLVATDALTKAKSEWALESIIEILDDEFLLNRQFAQKGIEDMLDVRLIDWGYRFYMTKAERVEPLNRLRKELLEREK